ncbi:MAG: reverse transcriptase domain-containing protein [Roseibium album]|uniref:reverse transcriptase domain-containing protein n=1 Tax=Roseibium album TaxID=311410 RepID=UPI0032EBE527
MQKIIEATNFDRDKILRLAYAQNDAYRSFKLPKKCGTGTRDIKIPGPSLMSLQRSILQNILSNYEVSENAHAYVSGRSIISHASKHAGATCFIHMDLRNCFENILTKTIFELFKNRNWEKSEAALLARLTTNDGSLPQGAPTSPYLCNLALFQLD